MGDKVGRNVGLVVGAIVGEVEGAFVGDEEKFEGDDDGEVAGALVLISPEINDRSVGGPRLCRVIYMCHNLSLIKVELIV